MPPDFTSHSAFAETDPALGLIRLAALLAEANLPPDWETVDMMSDQVGAGVLREADPRRLWPELSRALMGTAPGRLLGILRASCALADLLPEVFHLYGVPQISDAAVSVDLGEHLEASLTEAARVEAPLNVRFALLTLHVGKFDSPREHLPFHYKPLERGAPRVTEIAERFGVPDAAHDLALTAMAEVERIHRATISRAGPLAQMLKRLGAFDAPARYEELILTAACDYRAHSGRSGEAYPKGALLDAARKACLAVEPTDAARAQAIARAFGSQRWTGGAA